MPIRMDCRRFFSGKPTSQTTWKGIDNHFITPGYQPADVHPLVPYTGHFHLRQGANRQLQARWEDGEINFVEVVGRLQEVGYEGYLTLEYEHEPGWMDMDKCDVLTETIKMRDTVRPLLY